MHQRIEKSAFVKGRYIGYANGVWHIHQYRGDTARKWVAAHREHEYSPVYGATLADIGNKLDSLVQQGNNGN